MVKPLTPAYYVMTSIWGVIVLAWTGYLYGVVPTHERHSLQKGLLALAILKCCEVGLEGGWYSMCPWDTVDN